MKKLTVEEVEERVKLINPNLSLVKDTYINTHAECTWIDAIYGEFRRPPVKIFNNETKHPKQKQEELCQNWSSSISKYWEIRTSLDNKNNEDSIEVVCLKCHNSFNKKIKKIFEATNVGKSGCSICWKIYTKTEEYATVMSSRSAPSKSSARQKQSLNLIKTINSMSKEDRSRIYGHSKGKKQSEGVVLKRRENYRKDSVYKGLSQACAKTGAPYHSYLLRIKAKDITVEQAIEEAMCFDRAISGTDIEKMMSNILGQVRYDKAVPEIKEKLGLTRKPDFKLSDKIYLDCHGLIHHSEKYNKEINYHFNRRTEFEKSDLVLLQFWMDEIYYKKEIVTSIIYSKIGKNLNKINARDCEIRKVEKTTAMSFFEENHIMGTGPKAVSCIGLFYKEELLMCISFSVKNGIIDINRSASKKFTSIRGGLSKLLSYIEKLNIGYAISYWMDLRYGTGDLSKLGFKFIKDTQGWFWTNGRTRFHRLKCRANMDERKLTEKEHAAELGWYKVGDAGQRLWVKVIKSPQVLPQPADKPSVDTKET